MPPGPVKISRIKDGPRRWLHRFHVSRPSPTPSAVGSGTEARTKTVCMEDTLDMIITFLPVHQRFNDVISFTHLT